MLPEGSREKFREQGNTVNTNLLLDAVRAEVAYRNEALYSAGRSVWATRARRAARLIRAGRTAVEVPAQERRETERATAGVGEITR